MKNKLIGIVQVASTFIGTVVGAGFASGREIIQFFTQYQAFGTLGAILSGAFMTWIGTKMMLYAKRLDAYSFNELLSALFGERIGNVIQALLFFILLGMTGVMLAGAGAVFGEQLGWNRQFGIAFALIIGVLFLVRGVRGLLFINMLVVPLLVSFVLITFWINKAGTQLFSESSHIHWLLSAFNYSAFNLSTALIVLVPMTKEFKDERVIRLGGILGGCGLAIILIMSHLMMLGKSDISLFELPMAEMVRPLGTLMHAAFICVIFGEILTTFVGNIFGLTRQLHSVFPTVFSIRFAMLTLVTCTFLIGQFGYATLISTLYPLYGALCAVVFIYMCFVRLPEKKR
ncbi:transporter [Sporolactobacillus shoreicorticis]|uniref:Transporter n=1 Tax=Sporolactobacillus shoreicorticis TaxID=1923877 RepID=A0ABW5RYV0_9BACL|nr:transporter [Sporolactobacillus shoreicorticis]MCO7124971.1 transporter [Sporolactobacillus shoreicorticis]